MNRGQYQNYSHDFKAKVIAADHTQRQIFAKGVPRSTIHYWRHRGIGDRRTRTLESNRATIDVDLDYGIARVLCRALTDLVRPGTFKSKELAEVWVDLRQVLGGDSLRELRNLFPRDIRDKITGPACAMSDDGRCLKRHRHRIAASEIAAMRRLVESKQYAHFSISSLCWYAKRKGLVSCNRDTWYRYIHKFGWQRPVRNGKYKRKHAGLKASKPDEYWHVDVTHIKLSDGTKLFLQVILDNYSRRVLAWLLERKLKAETTAKLIRQASKTQSSKKVELVSDGGPENVNKTVQSVVSSIKPKIIHRIARVEIPKSNSMVERLFHSLKNQHLYSQQLDSLRDAKRNIKFYINQHNDTIPQSVLSGLTPSEAYTGVDPASLATSLAEFAIKKRQQRLEQNRINVCQPCKGKPQSDEPTESDIKCAI